MCCLAFDVLPKLPGLSVILLRPLFVSGSVMAHLSLSFLSPAHFVLYFSPHFPPTPSPPPPLPFFQRPGIFESIHSRGSDCCSHTPGMDGYEYFIRCGEGERICSLKKKNLKKKKVGEMSKNLRGEKVMEQ